MCDSSAAPLNTLQLDPMIDYINAVTGWNVRSTTYEGGERNNTTRGAACSNIVRLHAADDVAAAAAARGHLHRQRGHQGRPHRPESSSRRKTYYDMPAGTSTASTDAKLADSELPS